MTKREVMESQELRGVNTYIQSHRMACKRLYYKALRSPYEPLSTDEKIVLRMMRKKYKRQLQKT